ncbi:MAG: S8 family serine peptidase [Candidatus Heimdallarchaeota archaeon]|nr:S8 family serine peptidase [Candidatus Heimdallarchaeota archaeon]
MPIENLNEFISQASDQILLIEENKEAMRFSDTSTILTRIRTEVWDTLGFRGDSDMSVAVLDTGIDDSHIAFSPGYGDLDWSKKIIGWHDATADADLTPVDYGGHGSHVAGIIGSTEQNNTFDEGRIKSTYSLSFTTGSASGYLNYYLLINRTGTIDINFIWQQTSGSGVATGTYLSLNLPNQSQIAIDLSASANMSISYSLTDSSLFGIWEVRMGVDYGTGSQTLALAGINRYPYLNSPDSHARFSGVAPDVKLVGVKIFDNNGIGTSAEVIDAFKWVKNNKEIYHITIASGSFGFSATIASVDIEASALVNSGVLVIIAAGNDGQGSNSIFSPGQVDGVIMVAGSGD